MKKKLFIIGLFLFSISFANAQNQFENASFEEWEPEDENAPTFEPVEWSSIKTSDWDFAAGAAPIVMNRSGDAHTGDYSIYLFNVYNSLIDYVAPGTITNGRYHVDRQLDLEKSTGFTDINNSQWNTEMNQRPDSVVGWYKCKPSEGDFPTVKVILHTDSSSIPNADSATWIALAYIELSGTNVDTWTRFSTPFDYYNEDIPEYILSILTSGNGLAAVKDSEAWFDDMELIYNGTDIPENTAGKLNAYYTNGELIVKVVDQDLKNVPVKIVDLNGRIVFSDVLNQTQENRIQLNLQAGVYIITLSTNKGHLSKKVIVQ